MELIGAVDIGGTKIAVGLVGSDGRIYAQRSYPTMIDETFDVGLERIRLMFSACLTDVPGASLAGIGIGCTGRFVPGTGRLAANKFLPLWEGVSLVERIQETMGVPAAVENDADAAVLGEAAWGAGLGASCCIYVTVSTGIGCGVILDSKLFRGIDGTHPELGHHIIEWESGFDCYCGGKGCWESMGSGTAMATWYMNQIKLKNGFVESVDAHKICLLAQQQDPLAKSAIEREAKYLGIGLSNLINFFIPQVIVLGGGVMESWELFSDRACELIRRNCSLVPHEQVKLRRASLGARAGLSGAARVWYYHYQPNSENN